MAAHAARGRSAEPLPRGFVVGLRQGRQAFHRDGVRQLRRRSALHLARLGGRHADAGERRDERLSRPLRVPAPRRGRLPRDLHLPEPQRRVAAGRRAVMHARRAGTTSLGPTPGMPSGTVPDGYRRAHWHAIGWYVGEVPVSDRSAAQRLKTWGLIFGFWTLLALSYALSGALSSISEGDPPNWLRNLAWNLDNFWLWMALVPLLGWLGRRTAGRGWRRFCAVHVPASLAVGLAQMLVHLVLFWFLSGPGRMPVHTLGQYLRMEFAYSYHLAVLTYWIVLAALRGLDSRRRLRDEQLRSALLSDFLRLTLEERHAPQVPLARELEFLRCYLDIQQVRFQDRLGTQLDV